MLNSITSGKLRPMMPRHILLEFHLTLCGSLSSLLMFAQRHITLQIKGTPRLLKVMCLDHLDDALIHRLQQRRGVGWKKKRTLYHYASPATGGGGPSGYGRVGPETCNTPSARAPGVPCCTLGKCVPPSNPWNWQTNGQACMLLLSCPLNA